VAYPVYMTMPDSQRQFRASLSYGCPLPVPNAAARDRGKRSIIGPVRRNPSTVVVLAGHPQDTVLSAVAKSLNVVLVRPDAAASAGQDGGSATGGSATGGGIEAGVWALRRAAGISAPYVLVAADPLAAVAAEWRAMWEITAQPGGSTEFELRAAEALAAWRANQFELPDYYLVLAEEAASAPAGSPPAGATAAGATAQRAGSLGTGVPVTRTAGPGSELGPRPDFYLGPLRSVRPHRVAVAAPDPAHSGEPAAQAAALLGELGSLRHGPWWPSLDEIVRTARGFYPGSLGESPQAGQATLLS
jgi:hypothetical protein